MCSCGHMMIWKLMTCESSNMSFRSRQGLSCFNRSLGMYIRHLTPFSRKSWTSCWMHKSYTNFFIPHWLPTFFLYARSLGRFDCALISKTWIVPQTKTITLCLLWSIFTNSIWEEIFSLLDGFSRYNHVLRVRPDRLKTKFHTNWGTFAYRRMPFGLVNAGATFQRAMYNTFCRLIR